MSAVESASVIGRRLAHYEITAKLGEGGMGVVYRARDLKLERDVALKVLPEAMADDAGRLERFGREAKIVAGLNHPSIVTLHSVEEAEEVHFLTMELVEGRSLDRLIPEGGLELQKLFELAIPIADAVAAAHEAGVVHRDLKPANVMVTDDGRVKVLDFGLARLDAELAPPALTDARTEAITREGQVMGTAQYMSPEQARGESADARSDIFALGVLLYRMATGGLPFAGRSSAEVMSAILRDAPRPLSEIRDELPNHLGRVVSRCLEKEPRQRYQSALDVRNELEGLEREVDSSATRGSTGVSATSPEAEPAARRRNRPLLAAALILALLTAGYFLWARRSPTEAGGESAAAGSPVAERKRIAVLPFENLGPAEDAYFATGMTEELTSRLARVSGLGVISFSSARGYAEARLPMERIGEELGVDYVVEGRVRWAKSPDGSSRVRITPQLVQVSDATQVWSGAFERRLEDIFAIQAEIAGQVIEELGVALMEPERAAVESRPTDNMEAYQAYLQGLENWQIAGYDRQRFELAAELFERAAVLDPTFLEPLIELVGAYGTLRFGDGEARFAQKMREALDRAIALAPDSPLVDKARADWLYMIESDYDAAFELYEAASRRLPNDTNAVEMMGYTRRRQGRLADAAARLEQVLDLSPYGAHICHELGRTYEAMRRFADADRIYRRGVALEPDSRSLHSRLIELQIRWRGDLDAAVALAESAPVLRDGRGLTLLDDLDWWRRDWRAIRQRLEGRSGGGYDRDATWDQYELLAAYQRLGEEALAEAAERRFRDLAGEIVSRWPTDFWGQVAVALAAASAGDREAFEAASEVVSDLLGPDRFAGPVLLELRAEGLAHLGDSDAALDLVEEALAAEYDNPLTRHVLRLNPTWDPLRREPRYRALIDES